MADSTRWQSCICLLLQKKQIIPGGKAEQIERFTKKFLFEIQKNPSGFYQVAKLYMFAPSSGLFSCPLAMTDGAAATLQILGVKGDALKRLTSRDPKTFWTSGQWMTEPRGGSDVNSSTETVAVADNEGRWRLHGYKWFSSATDSDMALTLARVVADGRIGGLSMFYLKTRGEDGRLNGIQVLNPI